MTGVLTSTLKCLPFLRRVRAANTRTPEFSVPAGPVRFFPSSSSLLGRPLPAVPAPFLERPSPGDLAAVSPARCRTNHTAFVCRASPHLAGMSASAAGWTPAQSAAQAASVRPSGAEDGAEAGQAPSLFLGPAAGPPAPGPLPAFSALSGPGSWGAGVGAAAGGGAGAGPGPFKEERGARPR